ncbi:hypothetical protein EYF80_061852 [Liparis tanakae]|uniref:Uncharacterized protein n=1 Tax=Liparis tanakae TaxID=230148 RepID=A0A4Z2EHG3_9TELE|nr:hypothetical protein EYF80_061852 [Liparis tanakae]
MWSEEQLEDISVGPRERESVYTRINKRCTLKTRISGSRSRGAVLLLESENSTAVVPCHQVGALGCWRSSSTPYGSVFTMTRFIR